MKKTLTTLLLIVFIAAGCGPVYVVQSTNPPAQPPAEELSYQSFYDDLSPYGNWIDYPGYGYVWQPDVNQDFKPYATDGDWVYTDAGWTWSSDYPWGWAAFHYGRWFYDGGYGWMWIPGNEWAPAWVSWRGNNDYYGWAPLGPNVSANVGLYSYNPPTNYWNFVPNSYMGRPQARNYYVNESRNVTIINNTTIINNYSGQNRNQANYAPGPDVNQVSRYTGTAIRPVPLRQANTPGSRVSDGQFSIYRPRVNAAPANQPSTNIRPARVQNYGNNPRPNGGGNAQNSSPGQQNNRGNNDNRGSNDNRNNGGNNNGYQPNNPAPNANPRPVNPPVNTNPVPNNPRPVNNGGNNPAPPPAGNNNQNPVNNNQNPVNNNNNQQNNNRSTPNFGNNGNVQLVNGRVPERPAPQPNQTVPAISPANQPQPQQGNGNRPTSPRFQQPANNPPQQSNNNMQLPSPAPVNRPPVTTRPAIPNNPQPRMSPPPARTTVPAPGNRPAVVPEKPKDDKPKPRQANPS